MHVSTYRTYNLTVKFLKYKFNKKLLIDIYYHYVCILNIKYELC